MIPDTLGGRLELVPISTLKPHPENPRRGNLKKIRESIRRNGFYGSVLVQESSRFIIAGNHRFEAAAQEGLLELPATFIDVDDASARRILAVDNGSADDATYDNDYLARLLGSIRSAEGSLEGTGYDDGGLDALLDELATDGESDGQDPEAKLDLAEELLEKWKCQAGEIWEIGAHRLAIGSSGSAELVATLFGDSKARWMWTDPPYGVDYVAMQLGVRKQKGQAPTHNHDIAADQTIEAAMATLQATIDCIDQVIAEGAPFYIASPSGPAGVAMSSLLIARENWLFHQILVWVKNRIVLGHSDHQWRHEFVIYGWKKGKKHRWFGGRDTDTIFEITRPSKSPEHPTMKPVALIEAQLRNSSRKGDLGIDPFAGSGSTIVAAQNLGRRCYAIELEPKYGAVILERMSDMGLEPRRRP